MTCSTDTTNQPASPLDRFAQMIPNCLDYARRAVDSGRTLLDLKPILEDVDPANPNPLDALAEKYFHLPCSVKTPNSARFDSLRSIAADYRPDCVIDLVWQACLTYDVESALVREFAETELRLPYLKIEIDYSPSDSARIALRVQALFETVRQRRTP